MAQIRSETCLKTNIEEHINFLMMGNQATERTKAFPIKAVKLNESAQITFVLPTVIHIHANVPKIDSLLTNVDLSLALSRKWVIREDNIDKYEILCFYYINIALPANKLYDPCH